MQHDWGSVKWFKVRCFTPDQSVWAVATRIGYSASSLLLTLMLLSGANYYQQKTYLNPLKLSEIFNEGKLFIKSVGTLWARFSSLVSLLSGARWSSDLLKQGNNEISLFQDFWISWATLLWLVFSMIRTSWDQIYLTLHFSVSRTPLLLCSLRHIHSDLCAGSLR